MGYKSIRINLFIIIYEANVSRKLSEWRSIENTKDIAILQYVMKTKIKEKFEFIINKYLFVGMLKVGNFLNKGGKYSFVEE